METTAGELGPRERIADRFEVEAVLGSGAFGTTYQTRDLFRRQRAVVKVFANDTPEIQEIVETEARTAKMLRHPNIQAVLETGVSAGKPFLVYEWVEGVDLAKVLQSGPLGVAQALEACAGIVQALRAAHRAGLIHRDLKPANVLVPGWPQRPEFRAVRLLDFGIAGALRSSTQATRAGMIFGTPVYMSPEQVLGEPQTPASDVYALGLLLYEMLTGRKLRESDHTVALLRSILEEPPPPMPPSMPPHLANLISECLRRDPSARPTLDRFAAALAAWEEVQPTSRVTALRTAPAPVAPPRARRRPLRTVAAAIFLGCAALFLLLVRHVSRLLPALSAIGSGVFLTALGIAAGFWVRGRLSRPSSELKSQALSLAFHAKQHLDITATIALQVTDLVGRLRQIDQRILAGTVALMLNEYQTAAEGKDRQAALMNVVALSEKLGQRLSPWYVRYKEVIATFVAVAGAISGLITAYSGLHRR
jgi:hypothetical protein